MRSRMDAGRQNVIPGLKISVEQLTNNVHLATSARSICAFWIEGVPQLIVYLSHADTFILHLRPTLNNQSGKAR